MRRKEVWIPGQSICFAVGGAFSVNDGVVIGCQGSWPSVGSAGLGEVLEVLVVSVDLNRMCSSLDIDPPLPKPLYHRKYFFVVDWVVELSCCEFARVEADRVELPISGRLGQDAAEGEIGGIGFDGQGEFRLEDGCRSEGRLELTESCTCLVRLGKLNTLSSQSSKRRSESRIVKNEFIVEISKTQKRLHLLN